MLACRLAQDLPDLRLAAPVCRPAGTPLDDTDIAAEHRGSRYLLDTAPYFRGFAPDRCPAPAWLDRDPNCGRPGDGLLSSADPTAAVRRRSRGCRRIGRADWPGPGGGRILEMLFGHRFRPIWTMRTSVLLVAAGTLSLRAVTPFFAVPLMLTARERYPLDRP